MGFRYRKSIRLGGGFRINISGSGVGYSWGVPGYRITKTANGKIRQTASIPGTGLSYSTEESIYKSARKSALKEEPYTDTEVIQSTDRADYKDSDFKALMKRINRVCFLNKASLIVGAIGLLAFIVLHTPQRLFLTILSFIVFLYAHYFAPVNLEYDFTDEQFDAYEEWYNAWRKLFACDAVFYVPETHTNSSAKKNGGAEKTVSEEKALGMPALPYFLRTNVPVFSAALNKKESIYIFPDKVFYLHNSKISAYDLSEVSFNVDSVNCVTDQEHLLAFDILFWTGCREGEMLALLPKDLTDDDQLRIYKTYHRKKGQDILGPTKNSKKGGNRNVPIPHWLAEEFRTYCSKLYGLTPDDRVFYMTCTALNKELTRCTQITYLPDIRVHDLRHSHVSLCIELGYSIVLVAKRIGDTVPVVMRTYAHLYPNKQQELVSRLETLSTSSSSKDESDLMPLV